MNLKTNMFNMLNDRKIVINLKIQQYKINDLINQKILE